MAMLAGPRRKQKVINLRAKNSAWSNDSTKFGQRMLEKMGWSSGKGLGAKENGIVEHVIARYKNDDKGLGYEDRNDQWTKHEDDFNSLLASLSNGGDEKKEEVLHSGVSLEHKSKKSKARIHYHKYTRGKDLSRYSKKDLANIFGKKSFENEQEEAGEEPVKEEEKATEQVFTEKGSMEDYFKNKLAAFKTKNKIVPLCGNQNYKNEEANYSFRGFSGTTNDDTDQETNVRFVCQPFTFYNPTSQCEHEAHEKIDNSCEASVKRNKKKKKKNMELENKSLELNENEYDAQDIVKKSKKKEKNTEEARDFMEAKEKKKKKSKKRLLDESEPTEENDTNQSSNLPKKKKKKKNKDRE